MDTDGDRLENELREGGPERAVNQALVYADRQVADRYLELADRRARSDVELATAALDTCEQLASVWDRSELLPQVHYLRARMALNSGRPEEALQLIDQAKQEWMAHGRPLDACRTDLGRMNVLDDLGRHGEAIQTGEELIVDLEQLAHDDSSEPQLIWLRAAARENLGAAYGYTGKHQMALDSYRSAECDYRDVGGVEDVARCLANRGVELVARGQALEGAETISEAADLFDNADDSHSYAKCLGHLADAELLLGRYSSCLDRFAQARRLFESLNAHPEAARLALKAMRAYLALNLVDEAIDVGNQVEEVLSNLGLRHDLAEAQWLLAVANARDGDPETALAKLDQAVAGAVTSDDRPLQIRALISRSHVLSQLDRPDEALTAAGDALVATGEGSWPTEEWGVHLRLGQLVTGMERAEHLAKAKDLADELGLPHFNYAVLLELGRSSRDGGDLTIARQRFEEAVAIVERLRGAIDDENARTSFLEGRTSAHSALIALLAFSPADADNRLAFDVAERSKARTLVDLMAASAELGGESVRRNQPDGLGSTELQADLDACYSALMAGGMGLSRERRRAIRQRSIELETQIQRLRLETEGQSNRLSGSTDDGQAVPQPSTDEHIIEYHVVDQALLAFVWSGGRFRIVTELPTVGEVEVLVGTWTRQVQRFQSAMRLKRDHDDGLLASADDALSAIWARIFAPAALHLDPTDNLLIVPHGPLDAVPFHALPTPEGRVGDRWTTSIAPSYAIADSLVRRANRRPNRSGRSLVVGVADDAAPAVATEAERVADLLGGADLLLNDHATVEAVGRRLQEPADIIHVACHGLHRARNPMFSSLKLSDGWLTAQDVLSLSLDGSLVVLSACESGRLSSGRVVNEPVGLARSFLAAGAAAVVVSLWLAHDEATACIMTKFYEQLNCGSAPAVALRNAQTSMAATHPHPATWAPFIIHGGFAPQGEQ